MSKNLVIVESPSKAKTIKKYLGSNYEVVASQGHIIDLPASKFAVDIENDFKPEYITMRGKAKILKEIKNLAKDKENVYIATDPDREGEAIAWHIKNALGIDDNKKTRVAFHEITQDAVKNAIKNVRTLDFSLVDAQQTRRILDRIVGYKISPILWKKIKKGLSAGRVQSVALKIIIDKERLIKDFVKEQYYILNATLSKKDTNQQFIATFYGQNGKKLELNKKEQVEEIIKKINNKDFVVDSIKKTLRKKNPAPPFTTSTLQQEASRKFSFSVKKTMMVAQKLYEAGYITYMRTDSTRISDEARDKAKEYIISTFGNDYYENRFYKQKASAQDAHEAIRPTNIELAISSIDTLSKDEAKLLKLILNRFLASQMSTAIYDATKVITKVDEYTFVSNGSVLKFDGFMKLYVESKDDRDNTIKSKSEDNEDIEDNDKLLPILTEGELLDNKKLESIQKFTEPPARYTEATLVKVLEEKGIGRPSTYAPTIFTLLDRLYVEKEGKYLIPTELGFVVNEVMEKNFYDIVDVNFTANMEKELDDIAENKLNRVEFLKKFYTPFEKTLIEAEKNQEKIKLKEEVSDVVCENCGSFMVIKQGRFGKFLACPKYPECKNTKPILNILDEKCPKCGADVLIKKTKKKRIFYVCQNSPKTCDYISWTKPSKTSNKSAEEKLKESDNKKSKTTKTKTKRKVTKKSSKK